MNTRKMRIPLMMVCGLLTAGTTAMADSDKHCSSQTLSGDYGYHSEGVLLGIPGLPAEAQFRSIGMTHFDGNGNLTWLEHTVINGVPVGAYWTAASGTYTVNSNCTGSAVINTPNSFVPLNLAFLIVRRGTEVHTVLDGNAIATVFIKVNADTP